MTVLILALGIGVTTAAFSFIDAVLYRPQPALEDLEQLVALYADHRDTPEHDYRGISYPDYPAYRDQAVFQGLAVYLRYPVIAKTPVDNVLATAEIVTGNYFQVVGPEIIHGRALQPDDDVAGAPMAVVISERIWNTHFARDPAVIGQTLSINSNSFTIAGVVEEEFRGVLLDWIDIPDVWITTSSIPQVTGTDTLLRLRQAFSYMSVARLAPGVGIEQARSATAGIAAGLVTQYPGTHEGWKIDLLPVSYARFWPGHRRTIVPFLITSFSGTAILLLVACLNAAGLLVARNAGRRKEVALRQALGASRACLIRQNVVEALVLVAGAMGLGIWITHALRVLLVYFPRPAMILFDVDPRIDIRVLAFAVSASLVSVLLFALAPAWRATKTSTNEALRSGASLARPESVFFRQLLIVGQVALSLVLVIAAGLFSRSLNQMTDRDPGFETDNLLLATIDPRGVADQPRWSWTRVLEEIRSLPGVESASLSSHRPLGRVGARNVEIRVPANATRSVFNVSIAPRVTAGHFDTLGIPLSGTDFGVDASEKREIVVNEVLAELVWPGEDPVGRHLRLPIEDRDHRVVAVSKNRNCLSVLDAPTPCLYQTFGYLPMRSAVLVLRMSGPPLSISSTLRERIRRVDPAVALYDVRSMHAHLTELLSGPRLIAFLSRSLSMITLVLVGVGVFTLISFTVVQTTRHIGIRMALGADSRRLLAPLAKQALLVTCIGVALGLALSVAANRYIASQLFGVTASDPLTLVLAPVLLIFVAVVASSIPAIRATRLDPMIALRHE